jgi:hypothetical protein
MLLSLATLSVIHLCCLVIGINGLICGAGRGEGGEVSCGCSVSILERTKTKVLQVNERQNELLGRFIRQGYEEPPSRPHLDKGSRPRQRINQLPYNSSQQYWKLRERSLERKSVFRFLYSMRFSEFSGYFENASGFFLVPTPASILSKRAGLSEGWLRRVLRIRSGKLTCNCSAVIFKCSSRQMSICLEFEINFHVVFSTKPS